METITRRRLLQAAGITGVAASIPAPLLALTPEFVAIAAHPRRLGYWTARNDGTVVAARGARVAGGAQGGPQRVTGLAAQPFGDGFLRVAASGVVAVFGDGRAWPASDEHDGSAAIDIAADPRGVGHWVLHRSGQITAAGWAPQLGDAAVERPRTIASHPWAVGYWVVGRAGDVQGFGAAEDFGGSDGRVVGLAPTRTGEGYWLATASGKVRARGDAEYFGDARDRGHKIAGIAPRADGHGYWLLTSTGKVLRFTGAQWERKLERERARRERAERERIEREQPHRPPTPSLAVVEGIVVAASLEGRVRRLLRDAAADGVHLGGWGYRSYDRQVELRKQNCGTTRYAIYRMPASECSPPTARPGTSMHERGEAIDFYKKGRNGEAVPIAGTGAFRWLKRNAGSYGLYNLPSEPWHWSTNGR